MSNSYFRAQYEKQVRQQLCESFQTLDLDEKGFIQLSTLKRELTEMGYSPTDLELKSMSSAFGDREKHRIYLQDYLKITMSRMTNDTQRKDELMLLVDRLSDSKGKFSLQDIESIACQMGESDPSEISKRIFGQLDRNRTNEISFEEVLRVVNKVSNYS